MGEARKIEGRKGEQWENVWHNKDKKKRKDSQAGKAAHVCNGNTWEVGPERAGIKGRVQLQTLSENKEVCSRRCVRVTGQRRQ